MTSANTTPAAPARKHSHYHKPIPAGVASIDVYRLLMIFEVTDPAIQHAIKKLLVAGGRGAKDFRRDLQEAVDTIERRLEILDEDEAAPPAGLAPVLHAAAPGAPPSLNHPDHPSWNRWPGLSTGIPPDAGPVDVVLSSGIVLFQNNPFALDWRKGPSFPTEIAKWRYSRRGSTNSADEP